MDSVNGGIHLVKLHGVSFSYPGHDVFKDFSATVPPGMVIFQGDESTGKTTLIKLVAGELSVSSGMMTYPALGLTASSVLLKHQYFLVGEQADHWESLTAQAFFDHCHDRFEQLDARILAKLVDAFGLREHVEKNLYMLSRGSKRKVWLVAALACGAPIILMDDPFMALDHQSVVLLKDCLNEAAAWTDRALIITQHVPDTDLLPTHLIDLNKVS